MGTRLFTFTPETSGDDAEWTEMLIEMYKIRGTIRMENLSLHESRGEIAGVKSASLEIKRNSAYGFLRHESGGSSFSANFSFFPQKIFAIHLFH